MKKYKVIITDEAITDIEKIYHYIAYDLLSLENALKQNTRILNAIFDLEKLPEKYAIYDTKSKKLKNIRKMNVDNYAVYFIVNTNTVIVISVLYGASNKI